MEKVLPYKVDLGKRNLPPIYTLCIIFIAPYKICVLKEIGEIQIRNTRAHVRSEIYGRLMFQRRTRGQLEHFMCGHGKLAT
jgi:hypothetical protein